MSPKILVPIVALAFAFSIACNTSESASAHCSDGIKNVDETDVDCGGQCGDCGLGKKCLAATDCDPAAICSAGFCTESTCFDRIKGPTEADADCGGPCPLCRQGHTCTSPDQCASHECDANGYCTPGTCTDGYVDQEESDVDCGGRSSCGLCANGKHCEAAFDCASDICDRDHLCAAFNCADGFKNGDESDRDCGGMNCQACGEARVCRTVADCATNTCVNNTCINDASAPSCSDHVMNLGETDIDCGGGCAPCLGGAHCTGMADCYSRECTNNICESSSCSDQRQNQSETDVDCGGECPGCENTMSCVQNSDCLSNNCKTEFFVSTCADASCTDRRLNGLETDVDCSGACLAKCAVGKHCNVNADCGLNYCADGICQQPLCTDHILNGRESDTDCGGGSCPRCSNGKHCESAGDCLAGYCNSTTNLCATPACTDHVKNGAETDVDCGGGTCPACADPLHCELAADCLSNYCSEHACTAASCTDHQVNGFESDVDCGGPCSQKCANSAVCHANADCASGTCTYYNSTDFRTRFRCAAATCSGTVDLQDSDETDVDCGGVCSTKCAEHRGCLADMDCGNGLVCVGSVCSQTQCQNGMKDANEAGDDCGGPCPACGPTSTHVTCHSSNDCLSGFCDDGTCAIQDLLFASTFPVDGRPHTPTEEIQIEFNQPVVPTSLLGCTGRNAPVGCNVLLQDSTGAFVPVWVAQPRATPPFVTRFVIGHGTISDQRDPYTFTILSESAGPRAFAGGTVPFPLVVGFSCYPN